jgi:hypothetical protein
MGARSAVTVGRKTEVDLLLAALAAVDRGEAKVAVVEGEAGIGKTRLVRDLVSRVPVGTIVAFGRGRRRALQVLQDRQRPLSRILQKLAVANRTELASVAHRRGLVHP